MIVLDTKRGDTWETRLQETDLRGVISGPGAFIEVTATAEVYDISFDNSSEILAFPKRIDANATAVSYSANVQRRIFDDPVVPEKFDRGMFISSFSF